MRSERKSARPIRVVAAAVTFAAVLLTTVFSAFHAEHRACDAASFSGEVVMEVSSGRVLHAVGERERKYPASTTKILTALVVLESLPLDLTVRIPAQAAGVEGSSVYLKAGEEFTVEELLYALMLRSGNDAAVALALAAGGSIPRFASMMNERAKACGAEDSNFVNPHGLHDDGHYTTALDLARITAEAYKNADFRRIVSTRSTVIGEGESRRYLANKNKLLGTFEGANGVKTGYTKKSGRCLVGGAMRDGMQLVGVVLDRYDMWAAMKELLTRAFDAYEMRDVLSLPHFSGEGECAEVRFDERGEPVPARSPVLKSGEKIGVRFV